MIRGYARVSKGRGQRDDPAYNLTLQSQRLKDAGAEIIYADIKSGVSQERVEFNRMVQESRPGDQILVTHFDRFCRSVKHGAVVMDDLKKRQVSLRILDLGLDTKTPLGEAMIAILLAFAQLEWTLAKERYKEGVQTAKEQGRHGGRPHKLTLYQETDLLRRLDTEQVSLAQLAREFNITTKTACNIRDRRDKGLLG